MLPPLHQVLIRSEQEWAGGLTGPPASQIQVSVLNGTGTPDLAARTAAGLRKLGFDVTSVGNAPPASYTTVSYPGAAEAGSAWTVMNALTSQPAARHGGTGPVTLTIGSDFAGIKAPAAPPAPARHGRQAGPPAASSASASSQPASTASSPSAVQTRNAAASICSSMPAANPDPGTPP